jgi:hypothetical protein
MHAECKQIDRLPLASSQLIHHITQCSDGNQPVTNQMIKAKQQISRAIAAVTIKIPEPIIEPATRLVASINPKERLIRFIFDIYNFNLK